MLKDIAKDAAMEELSRLSWRVRINFNLIVTFIIIVAYLSISSWKVLETIESYKDLRRRVSALEKEGIETKNVLLWIQSDVLVIKNAVVDKAFPKDGKKASSEPPKIIYQTIVQDKDGNIKDVKTYE